MRWRPMYARRNVLITNAGGYDYELDFEDAGDRELSSAMEQAHDWIQHVGGKTWASPAR